MCTFESQEAFRIWILRSTYANHRELHYCGAWDSLHFYRSTSDTDSLTNTTISLDIYSYSIQYFLRHLDRCMKILYILQFIIYTQIPILAKPTTSVLLLVEYIEYGLLGTLCAHIYLMWAQPYVNMCVFLAYSHPIRLHLLLLCQPIITSFNRKRIYIYIYIAQPGVICVV